MLLRSHPVLTAVVQLRVEGEGLRTVELSLQDLKTKFKKHSLSATLQCSGNRRHELSAVKPIKGLDWSIGGCTQQLSSSCTACMASAHCPVLQCSSCGALPVHLPLGA